MGWIRENGIPGESGNPEFKLTPRISGWPMENGVTRNFSLPGSNWSSGWQRKHGAPGDSGKSFFRLAGDSGNRKLQVNPETRGSGDSEKPKFRVTQGSGSYGWLGEIGVSTKPVVPGDSGNPGWLREPGGNQEFRVNSRTRCSGWIREPGVPGDSGKPELRATTGTRSCGSLRDPGVTPGNRCSGWLRVPGVPSDYGNPLR